MTDRSLRTLSRGQSPEGQARLLRARMRAGEREPGTAARLEGRQRCDACTTWGCTKCKTAGHVPDPSKTYTVPDLPISAPARVRAYSGDEVARLVAEVPSALGLATDLRSWWTVDRWDPAQWARGLLDCVPEDAHLVGEGPCSVCKGSGSTGTPGRKTPCIICGGNLRRPGNPIAQDGTGRVSWRVSLRHHLAVTVGVAVGRACLPKWSNEHLLTAHDPVSARERAAGWVGSCCHAPGIALDAAALWARCPCEEHLQAWEARMVPGLPNWVIAPPGYVPDLGPDEPLRFAMRSAAARLLGHDEVRRVASEAVLGWASE